MIRLEAQAKVQPKGFCIDCFCLFCTLHPVYLLYMAWLFLYFSHTDNTGGLPLKTTIEPKIFVIK